MKTKILFFIAAFLCLFSIKLFATWDLRIKSDVPADITIEAISLPFEGISRWSIAPFNRPPFNSNGERLIFNGSMHRRYGTLTSFNDHQIVKHEFFNQTRAIFASCFGETHNNTENPRWGFAKYLITIRNRADTSKTIRFFLNNLDSQFGRDSITGEDPYLTDTRCEYLSNSGNPYVIFSLTNSSVYTYADTIYLNQQYKEIKVWKAYLGLETPLARDFKARTTPFPVNDTLARNLSIREYIIGTTIIFDGVYENAGTSDRYGYNTVNYPYYFNSPQILPFNRIGLTYSTPGQFNTHFEEFGIKITADAGDTLIFADSIWFFINGSDPVLTLGDTLLLKDSSTVVLGEGAEIFTYNGGVLINEGANIQWSDGSCQRAFPGTSINLLGSNHTINNGAFLVIDGGATLRLGDNTTLTFDGENSFLKLRKNADVVLGTNSKIVFKNGAYIKADTAEFTSSSLWDGIYFENAGTSSDTSKIIGCTFTNANNNLKFFGRKIFTLPLIASSFVNFFQFINH